MKLAALALIALAAPAAAQTQPTPNSPATTVAAKLNLDTPIETIVADPKAKAVLDADLPGLSTHAMYDQFKTMTLNQLAGMAPDKLTPEALAKTAADLAVVK